MTWPLLTEHGYLGASIEDGHVVSYFNEMPLAEALEGVALFDLTGSCYRFISGGGVQAFAEALTASKRLTPGSCAFSAVLSGDGSVVSVPIVVRGGEHEYVLVDATPRREVLDGWISFVSAIERDGAPAFGDVSIEDASGMLVPLMLAGSRCRELIGDYTGGSELPGEGNVATVPFDGVPCVLAHLPMSVADAWIVFCPTSFAVSLFRSFLSFAYVAPEGHVSLGALLELLPWGPKLATGDRVEAGLDELSGWGLLRADGGFIGERGLGHP
ncbi:MAG: hypothetical protein Q4D39_00870 [Coriobacteriaceae bacterium]|nr:hypothetical protein [Coriobacteriaceae bacterium]